MVDEFLPYWLAANHIQSIRPSKFWQAINIVGDIKKLFITSALELKACGFSSADIKALSSPLWQKVDTDLIWLNQQDHHVLTFDNAEYPALLKEISDPPLVLYVRGNKACLNDIQIALVGSRAATPSGVKLATSFAQQLAELGLTITSGLAAGIDAASHRGAIAAHGKTIAVLGTGVDEVYPKQHRGLVDAILQCNGALISEFPRSTPPQAFNFPRRNRIISGISLGVLVVEAELKSGSLITARHAVEQGREVFAIPGNIQQTQSRGCHHLIRQGAILVEVIADIVNELNVPKTLFLATANPCVKPASSILSAVELHVLQQIEYEITPLDVILLRSGLTAGELSSILLSLEMAELLQVVPGGYVREMAGRGE